MLKAVAQTEYEARGGEAGVSEPDNLILQIPGHASSAEFLQDLEERLGTLVEMRDLFSAQVKVAEAESAAINQIGLSFQVLGSIDFNDTYQVVLNIKE